MSASTEVLRGQAREVGIVPGVRTSRRPSALAYDTALLDFHGTFTSNRGRLAHALNTAYVEIAGRQITRDEFRAVLDRPMDVPVGTFLDNHINGQMAPGDKENLINIYLKQADRSYVPKHRWIIRRMAEMGVTCAIVTNGNEQIVRDTITKWGLDSCVVDVYGRGPNSLLHGIPKKPSPEVIEFVIEDLRRRGHNTKRHRTLMLGDYTDDIGAGNSAGVHTAFVVTGPNQRPEYYSAKPTYSLLDSPSMEPFSEWLKRENTYPLRSLPALVAGELA